MSAGQRASKNTHMHARTAVGRLALRRGRHLRARRRRGAVRLRAATHQREAHTLSRPHHAEGTRLARVRARRRRARVRSRRCCLLAATRRFAEELPAARVDAGAAVSTRVRGKRRAQSAMRKRGSHRISISSGRARPSARPGRRWAAALASDARADACADCWQLGNSPRQLVHSRQNGALAPLNFHFFVSFADAVAAPSALPTARARRLAGRHGDALHRRVDQPDQQE